MQQQHIHIEKNVIPAAGDAALGAGFEGRGNVIITKEEKPVVITHQEKPIVETSTG